MSSASSKDAIIALTTTADWKDCLNILKAGGHLTVITNPLEYARTACAIEDAGFEIRDQLIWLCKDKHMSIVLARKPLEGTVIANIDKHGVGGLNIDACRIKGADVPEGRSRHGGGKLEGHSFQLPDSASSMPAGRWPANVIHDGSDKIVSQFPHTKSGTRSPHHNYTAPKMKNTFGKYESNATLSLGDEGSAGRFYYEAKNQKELIKYLTKLTLPDGGKLLKL